MTNKESLKLLRQILNELREIRKLVLFSKEIIEPIHQRLTKKFETVITTLMLMQRESDPVYELDLIKRLQTDHSLTPANSYILIKQLLREGIIYEPKEDYLRKT